MMTNIFSDIDSMEEMAERRQDCQLALVEALSQRSKHHPSSQMFWREVDAFRIVCIPRLRTLEQVYEVNDHADLMRLALDCLKITLFKVPRLVNNVESYVSMLVCEHFGSL